MIRLFIFVFPILFSIIYHIILLALVALIFDLEVPTRRTAAFFLTSKTSVNRWSGFLALRFLRVKYGPNNIGMLSVTIAGLDTIAASIIDL